MTEMAVRRASLGADVSPAVAPAHAAGSLYVRFNAAWDRYWFGQIAAARPYLLMKVVWCVLAFDVWVLRVPLGGRYGAGEFGVAHFRWLDALQPLPTPGLYVGLMLATGMLALVCVLTDAPRWVRALVALMYTYGWAMSLHDGYQHHYFLSLALATFVFFPRLRARDLFRAHGKLPVTKRRRGRPSEPARPTAVAWGYALLGATVGIVYLYTAVTKLDAEWWAGDVMGRLGRRSFGPIAAQLIDAGVPGEIVWLLPGLGVFALECLVAAGYVVAVRLDRTKSRRLRTLTWLAFLAAVGFHISAETVLRLRIGWFSYYMIALACIYFLPNPVLYRLGTFAHQPVLRLTALAQDFAGRAGLFPSRLATLTVVGVAGGMAAIGISLDLPGSRMVGLLAAAALAASSVALARRCPQDILRYSVATGLAGMLMWVTVGQSDARPLYHTHVGRDLQKRGDLSGAAAAFERAKHHAPDDKSIESYLRRLRRQADRTEE